MRSWRCIETWAVLVLSCLPSAARAQCAACTNPNLAGGGADFAGGLGRKSAPEHRLSAGLAWAYVQSPDVFVGTQKVVNAEARSSTVQSVLLSLDAEHRRGTGIAALLPAGTVVSRVSGRQYRDTGISDLELRGRQDLMALLGASRLRIVPALGLAMPTGTYSRSSGNVAKSTNQYASLGRGAWWLLADLDATLRVSERWTLLSGIASRHAMNDAPDGFAWGREVRARGGFALNLGRVQVAVALDQLWRAQSTEVLGGDRVASISTGGAWLSLTPALRVDVGQGLALAVGARLPLWRDVLGLQNVEGLNGFAAVSWSVGVRD